MISVTNEILAFIVDSEDHGKCTHFKISSYPDDTCSMKKVVLTVEGVSYKVDVTDLERALQNACNL